MARRERGVKPQIRTLGIDDSRFRFKEGKAYLVAVQMRGHDVVEATLTEMVDIDGWDATDAVIRLVLQAPAFRQREYVSVEGRRPEPLEEEAFAHRGLHAVLIDGVTVAGFNIIDVERVYDATRVPILALTTRNPDLGRIHRALEKNFEDWPERFKVLERNRITSVRVGTYMLHGHVAGIHPLKAAEIVAAVTKPGHRVPEPIRVADQFASAMPTDSPPEIAEAEIAPQPAAVDGTPITQEDARMVLIAAYKARRRVEMAAAAAPTAPAAAAAAAKPAAPPAGAKPAAPAVATSAPAAPAGAGAAAPKPAPAPAAAGAARPAAPAPPPRKKEEARIDWDKAVAAATWRPSAKRAAAEKEVGPVGRFDTDFPLRKKISVGNVEYITGKETDEEKGKSA